MFESFRPLTYSEINEGERLITLRLSIDCRLSVNGPFTVTQIGQDPKQFVLGDDGEKRYFRELGCPALGQPTHYHRTFAWNETVEVYLRKIVEDDLVEEWLAYCGCEDPVSYVAFNRSPSHEEDSVLASLFDQLFLRASTKP